ncbi:thioesterase family protein [uncultured Eubacterium sp.]|uniref:thioesterase family protein n=1 Tax=uncultured Eubacterium sp. TaxID=165185 RepID=UPI0025E4E7BB|nr:hotdog domain-containing protein [uncultured Eubacterium sp.]
MKEFEHELKGEAMILVNSAYTAIAARSGSLEVLGTPYMIALMEKATCSACESLLDEGETTVGTAINITHDKAIGLGELIKASATLKAVDGRKLTFDVIATDSKEDIIGKGTITRFVVNGERFMSKVESK